MVVETPARGGGGTCEQGDDPEIVTRFLLGALRRGAMLVATSPNLVGTRDAVLLSGYAATRLGKAVQ